MVYLSSFYFPGEDAEWAARMSVKRTSYQTMYPFYVLPQKGMNELFFSTITILYGGNGCGKSTVLNVIAEKLRLDRESPYNRSSFFEQFVDMCKYSIEEEIPRGSRVITSDDVFDFMLSLRAVNEGIDRNRDAVIEEYHKLKGNSFRLQSLDDYDKLRRVVDARRMTESRFTVQEAGKNAREHSNGESSKLYFRNKILDDTLCLLDEPENSLSPENQRELADYIQESARYCGNQFIISTHSPFLLAMEGAKIINMDDNSKVVGSWTELAGAKAYYSLFKAHADEFEN